MADLIVTQAALEQSASKLKQIQAEFDEAGSNVERNADVWGQSDLAAAMEDFVDNWLFHRDKMKEDLDTLAEKLANSIDAWTDAETQLAKTFES